ncbi:hypothetical protein ZWY2020_029917 [Hordeum vulgare]|nr:hypothetical protein ZWY2020_029917 [Hordeum vulgare]
MDVKVYGMDWTDPKELRRLRDRERYAQNRDEILKRQRLSREKMKTANRLLNDDTTVSHTPATDLSSMQNSADERVPHNHDINLTNEKDSNWLHRNDAYQRQQRHGTGSTVEDAAGEDRNDDPYGIFEPVVEHTSLEG